MAKKHEFNVGENTNIGEDIMAPLPKGRGNALIHGICINAEVIQ